MAPPRKYFTEEERRAAARASARRSYYKKHPLKPKRLGRRTKKASYALKYYWQKRAVALGYANEDWRRVLKMRRALSRQKHWYFSDAAIEKRTKGYNKSYYQKRKSDPEYIERMRKVSARWKKEHPERAAMLVKKWHDSHKEYIRDYYNARYSANKRAERQRMLMAF